MASAAGCVAFEIAPAAPASKIASSHAGSIDVVSTITATSSCSALICPTSSTACSEPSMSSTRTTSGPASTIACTDPVRPFTWPSSLNSPLLRNPIAIASTINELSATTTSRFIEPRAPTTCMLHRSSRMVINLIAPPSTGRSLGGFRTERWDPARAKVLQPPRNVDPCLAAACWTKVQVPSRSAPVPRPGLGPVLASWSSAKAQCLCMLPADELSHLDQLTPNSSRTRAGPWRQRSALRRQAT